MLWRRLPTLEITMRRLLPLLVFALPLPLLAEPIAPKAALQQLHDLIGTWRATGEPLVGTREEKQKNFWTETIAWEWKFKGDDAWLRADFTKGKLYSCGELRYLPDSEKFQLTLTTTEQKQLVFTGTRQEKKLVLERVDEASKDTHRITFHLLHVERHLVRYEVQPAGKSRFVPQWQVGATKEGVVFGTLPAQRECIVSGGTGTMPVSYKGQTYYVCCGGCRDAFNDNPEKYVREFEAKKKQP
jgi:YHS domain-containing protein